jgi:hypothetical protein
MATIGIVESAAVDRALQADRVGLNAWLSTSSEGARGEYVQRWLDRKRDGGPQRITHAIAVIGAGIADPERFLGEAAVFPLLTDVYSALLATMSVERRSVYFMDKYLLYAGRVDDNIAALFTRNGITPEATRRLVAQYLISARMWGETVTIPAASIANSEELLDLVITQVFLKAGGFREVEHAWAAVYRQYNRDAADARANIFITRYSGMVRSVQRFTSNMNDLKSLSSTTPHPVLANPFRNIANITLLQSTCDMVESFLQREAPPPAPVEIPDSDDEGSAASVISIGDSSSDNSSSSGVPDIWRLNTDDARLIERLYNLPLGTHKDTGELVRRAQLAQQQFAARNRCKNDTDVATGTDIIDLPYMFVLPFFDKQCILVTSFCALHALKEPQTRQIYGRNELAAADRRINELLDIILEY